MAEYHYSYNHGGSHNDGTPPGGPNRGNNNSWSWIVLLIVLLVAPPVGVALLVFKLLKYLLGASGSASTPQTGTSSAYRYRPGGVTQSGVTQSAVRPSGAVSSARSTPAEAPRAAQGPVRRDGAQSPVKRNAGRGFLIGGGILTGVFGIAFLGLCLSSLGGGALTSEVLGTLGIQGGFLGAGLALLYTGVVRRRKARLYLQYLALIGKRETVPISTLARAAGRSEKKVAAELQDMLDLGILPMGYVDLDRDRLMLTNQGIEDAPVQEEAPSAAPEEDESDILRQIKAVNDSIPDPVMSAKIDRIGEITGKILDYQRNNPSKASQLRGFLNYYLPTTLKILRAYAQLDQQGVEGENISATKARIEGMMDKVVEGFEKQLDLLFQDDALDITSDVAVLERMLDKDGLGQGGMTLGG